MASTDPKIATQGQWEDLATRVKAKADSTALSTVATSGSYNDLLNKPTIPTVNNATLTIKQNDVSKGTFTANASANKTISITDTTYSDFTGATDSVAGSSGLVPAPAAGDNTKYLRGDGTWQTISAYSLPPATTTTLGGVIVGAGLNVDANGIISTDTFTTNEWNALWA